MVVVGLGPGGTDLLTAGATAAIERVPHRWLRTRRHPSAVAMRSSILRNISLVALSASPVVAGDYYVDPVNGNDANSGTSASNAWRHLSHVIYALGHSSDTVHLAPGTYGPAATGESFPFFLHGQYIVGDRIRHRKHEARRELPAVNRGKGGSGLRRTEQPNRGDRNEPERI